MLPNLGSWPVPAWAPPIAVSDQVSDVQAVERFIARVSAGFVAPAVEFGPPEALTVMGWHFAVISEKGGLIPASVHTTAGLKWHQTFAKVRNIRLMHEVVHPPLIAANSGYDTYYHWTAETICSLLIHRLACPDGTSAAVAPTISRSWQRETLELFGLTTELIEVATSDAAVFDQAIQTNLTGRDFGFQPHPEVLRQVRDRVRLDDLPASPGKLIYVARLDAANRRPMANEEALCAIVRDLGFEIIEPGQMPVKALAAAFANATLIVAPHGASLVNLLYSNEGERGPAVIELQQEAYLSPTYAKLAQAKSLDYAAIINPCVDQTGYHHNSAWHADLLLIERILADKIRHLGARA